MNENVRAVLSSILGHVHNYSSMISAADKMPSIDFEPKFARSVADVHALVDQLPANFYQQNGGLIELLKRDSYHFEWSQIEGLIAALVR